jgi:ubiquinone/menaquinone biosynthesis C-methylase UbiE
MTENRIQKQVRQFYDEVGWQKVENNLYQNTQFEDLRQVSRDYIHRCHLRVNQYLNPTGKFLLDAGSGPVQYPEYLTYSAGYEYRVCLDVSLTALLEARERLKEHGLCILGNVTNMPFPKDRFDGIVSLHTLHHLTVDDQITAYYEVYRTLSPGASGVVVNGWKKSPLMQKMNRIMALMESFTKRYKKQTKTDQANIKDFTNSEKGKLERTFVDEFNAPFLKEKLTGKIPIKIFVWRSVNVRFLRALVHSKVGGKFWLKLLYWLEEKFPHYLGENGAYPLIVINKQATIN